MGQALAPSSGDLLASRGVARALESYVVGVVFDRGGGCAGFGLGDGMLAIGACNDAAAGAGEWPRHAVHDGGLLALAADPEGGFVSGGDDGALCRIGLDGTVVRVAQFGSRWVEQVAVAEGVLAAAVGRNLLLFDRQGQKLKELAHPSTVTGVAFDAKGKRVAASHYGGASLWFVGAREDKPRLLEWKGSHTAVTIHPLGEAVVTAMQENALHGWRLADGQHMRMSGYPAKTGALSWSRHGKWLASSGADAIVLWPFSGGGPMGKPPLELAPTPDVLCTRVSFHPQQEIVAAGFADGTVVLAEIAGGRLLRVKSPGEGAVTALAWNFSGSLLALGTEQGFAAVVDLSAREN